MKLFNLYIDKLKIKTKPNEKHDNYEKRCVL